MIDSIEYNVDQSVNYAPEATQDTKVAKIYRRKSYKVCCLIKLWDHFQWYIYLILYIEKDNNCYVSHCSGDYYSFVSYTVVG